MKKYFSYFYVRMISILIILWTGAELIAWYFDGPQPYSALFYDDEALGFTTPRATDVVFNVYEDMYRVSFNGDGSSDYLYETAPDVLVLGDGLIAGLELSKSQRLAVKLSRARKKGVLNLAVTGYGSCQQYLQIDRYLRSHTPPESLVLVINLPSDLIDSGRNLSEKMKKPVFVRENDQWMLVTPKSPSLLYKLLAKIWKSSRLISGIAFISERGNIKTSDYEEPIIDSQMIESTKFCLGKISELANIYRINLVSVIWSERNSVHLDGLAKNVVNKMSNRKLIHVTTSNLCKDSECYVRNTKHFNQQSINSLVNLIKETI